MPKHKDFQKIETRFISQYGDEKGTKLYFSWLNKKGYDDTKPLTGQKKESKEKACPVKGVEIKETETAYHIKGLIATTHVDEYDKEEKAAGIPDKITLDTLKAWEEKMNSGEGVICGIHHSEARNGEYGAKADTTETPAKVVELPDGEHGLYVDTKVLKDDSVGMQIVSGFESGDLNSFSITYDTQEMQTTDFEFVEDRLVRILQPETRLFGYTAAGNPVNPNAVAVDYGFKEFKEFMVKSEKSDEDKTNMERIKMESKEYESKLEAKEAELQKAKAALEAKELEEKQKVEKTKLEEELKEKVETARKEAVKDFLESKEFTAKLDAAVEEKAKINSSEEIAPEIKEFIDALSNKDVSIETKMHYAGTYSVHTGLLKTDGSYKSTGAKEGGMEFKSFGVNGRLFEVKALSIGDNANTYVQSQAELDDVYNPMIWNLLNQETVTWNYLDKVNESGKGNNYVQFRVKIGTNSTAAFYTGNSVSLGAGVRQKYQTKFKKAQVGVEIDGDMIAAANGSSIGDVWNVEIASATEDLLSLMNEALFAEKGAETDTEPLGFEYITDSVGNTTLYGVTRSAANKLAPDTATDTYIDGAAGFSLPLARQAITHCTKDGSKKRNLFFVCDPVVGDYIKESQDDKQRYNAPTMTRFGFETDLFIDGVPVLEDKDCNDDDLFLVDKMHHKIHFWVPPTLELLGKTADSEKGFVKTYYAVANTAPRRMVQIYGITSAA